MTCPECGSPLIHDAGISKTEIDVRLTCDCGFSQKISPSPSVMNTLTLVAEYQRTAAD